MTNAPITVIGADGRTITTATNSAGVFDVLVAAPGTYKVSTPPRESEPGHYSEDVTVSSPGATVDVSLQITEP